MDPYFISGLITGDGCFSISFDEKGSILFFLNISQSEASLVILQIVKDYFGVTANIVPRVTNTETGYTTYGISTSSVELIRERIIPHFDKYPVVGRKAAAYQTWRELFFRVQEGEHHTPQGYLSILEKG